MITKIVAESPKRIPTGEKREALRILSTLEGISAIKGRIKDNGEEGSSKDGTKEGGGS